MASFRFVRRILTNALPKAAFAVIGPSALSDASFTVSSTGEESPDTMAVATASYYLSSRLSPGVKSQLGPYVRCLADPAEKPINIIRAMERAATSDAGLAMGLVNPIFLTASHKDLLSFLALHTLSLSKGRFIGYNGLSTRNLQGPKGIGKTTTLRDWTALCEAAYPNVIGIYISCERFLTSDAHPLAKQSAMELVAEELRRRGIPVTVNPRDGDICLAVHSALRSLDYFLLLIVDEIEELYRVAPTDANLFKLANATLGDLQWIGTQSTGRFGALLCGSSAVTPLLITGNAAGLTTDFPRVSGAPNLNGTKFRERRIATSLPTDVRIVRDVLEVHLARHVTLEQARLVTFIAGSSVRSVTATAFEGVKESVVFNCTPQSSMAGARTLSSDQGKLYRALLKRMACDNATLLSRLCALGRLNIDAVASTPWEAEFQPLSWQVVQDEWDRLVHDGVIENPSLGRGAGLSILIYNLCDKGWLLYDGICNCMPMTIYPCAVSDVVIEHIGADSVRSFLSVWDITAEKVWNTSPLRSIEEPRVQAVVAAVDTAIETRQQQRRS
jgi:hypothetical protein